MSPAQTFVPQVLDDWTPTTLYAARGRLIPFNSNSPTGSTFTAFSTFINTRGLMRICPCSLSSQGGEATLESVPIAGHLSGYQAVGRPVGDLGSSVRIRTQCCEEVAGGRFPPSIALARDGSPMPVVRVTAIRVVRFFAAARRFAVRTPSTDVFRSLPPDHCNFRPRQRGLQFHNNASRNVVLQIGRVVTDRIKLPRPQYMTARRVKLYCPNSASAVSTRVRIGVCPNCESIRFASVRC
jgi:hypothetical protein